MGRILLEKTRVGVHQLPMKGPRDTKATRAKGFCKRCLFTSLSLQWSVSQSEVAWNDKAERFKTTGRRVISQCCSGQSFAGPDAGYLDGGPCFGVHVDSGTTER